LLKPAFFSIHFLAFASIINHNFDPYELHCAPFHKQQQWATTCCKWPMDNHTLFAKTEGKGQQGLLSSLV
jgi:hypothetical protein